MNGTAKTTTGKIKIFSAFQGVETGKYINPLTVFEWKAKQTNWLQLPDNTWVNCGTLFQYASIISYPTSENPPPVPPTVVITHTILIDNIGRISVDGGPFV